MFAQHVPSALVSSKTFLLNPRREGFLNGGERRFYDFRSSSAIGLTIIAVLFGIFGGAMGYSGVREVTTRLQLAQSGVEISATVTHLEQSTSTDSKGNRTTDYYLTYLFHLGQASNDYEGAYSYRQKISRDTYSKLHYQDLIPIRYLPDDPKVSRYLKDMEDDGRFALLLGAVFLGITLIPVYFGVRQWRRNQRLAQEGQFIAGEITEAGGHRARAGFQLSIRYKFRSPEGIELSRKESLTRNDLNTGHLPKTGTTVAVIYVNDKLFRIL
jgi:Protein of unknown function (DUF3592)